MAVVLVGWAVATVVTGMLLQPFVIPIASTPPAVDARQLEQHVRYLSQDLHPRNHEHHENLERAAAYIQRALEAFGADVSIQEVVVEGTRYRNVIAKFGSPTGPVRVIGAHYDSHGDTPGADDNASGVAGLLELARLLGRSPPPRAIELVAYTLEEPPHFRTEHMGSAWHARSMSAAHRDVELMLSLEMIGYFSDEPGSQRYPFPALASLYPDRGNFIALVGRLDDFGQMRKVKAAMAGATTLPVRSINAPATLRGVDFSDHLNYWNEGMPAIMVTDTAFMRNRNYHQPQDTFERLDYERMAKVVQGVYAFAQRP
ncbi:M28 family peptidase [Hydrogenophaga sp.]|uniref:M28 family peptidase n=1 Tax=Hydrogenophaga sp. TaxID=1904254 RepID=UPI002606F7BE|nr:M28 family peptidase [Hydrogenophaga sp.]MCW5655645.1 M28 family peptidase [Hydrogenophaga sp.]